MPDLVSNLQVIRFATYEVDLRAGELRKSGIKVKLSGQPLQILAILLEHPGELVTREQLQRRLWPSDTFVDFDRGLNAAINRVREALGDSAENPRFVETLPRRGYRFIGQVDQGRKTDSKEAEPASSKLPDNRWVSRIGSRFYIWAGVVALSAVGALFTAYFLTRSKGSAYSNLNVMPLTSYPGAEMYPSFSPDGNEVVFAWNGGESGLDFDLYRKQVGSEKAMRLTEIQAPRIAPAWSPDGHYIAYIRARSGEQDGLFLIPSLGGPPRKLSEVSTAVYEVPSLGWSPDGKWLAFPGRETSVDYAIAPGARIWLLNVDTLERRILPYPSPTCTVALGPAFSRDGNQIASYCAEESFGAGTIYIQSLQGHTIRSFQRLVGSFRGLTWTSDSEAIVYSLNNSLWRQAAVGGIPEPLLFGHDASAPTTPRTGNRLAFVRANPDADNLNIWRLNLSSATSPEGAAVRVISSSRNQLQPRISPDGKHIAFVSQRSGSPEIWVADSDGSNLVQLTTLGAVGAGSAAWAPDSRRIVFDSRVRGHAELYVVDATGGPAKPLETGTPDASTPWWSRDGGWIYFSVSVGKAGIWKVPADGGVPVQLTSDKGLLPVESLDATHVLYLRRDWNSNQPCALGSVTVNGTDIRSENCPELHAGSIFTDEWTPGPNGIYFLTNRTNPVSLNLLNFSTGKIQHVADVPGRLAGASSPTLSADGHTLAFATADPLQGDLIMVEGFR